MASNKSETAAPAKAPEVEVDHVTLTEFCMRLSATVRRPELLAGFERTEIAKGIVKDTVAAFEARFDAFVNAPV